MCKAPHQWRGYGSLTIFCSDHGNHGMNIYIKESYDEKTITITTLEQNDAPIIHYERIDGFITKEDEPLSLKGICIIDNLDLSDNLTLTLEAGRKDDIPVGGFSFYTEFTNLKNVSIREVGKIKPLGASPLLS